MVAIIPPVWSEIVGTPASNALLAAALAQKDVMFSSVANMKAFDVTTIVDGSIAVLKGYSGNNDGGGGMFMYSAGTSTAENIGTIVAPNVGSGRWLRMFQTKVDPKWFGAKGLTDDTAAIEAAATFAFANKYTLFFSLGTFKYNGTGLTSPSTYPISIEAESRSGTLIILGDSSYLINKSDFISNLDLNNLTIQNGLGAVRLTYAGTNVNPTYRVNNCRFYNYTKAAISHNSSDMPYWKIRDCVFWSANDTTSIGVALSGLTDGSVISDCSFFHNRVGIKTRKGGNNLKVKNCDFMRYAAYVATPRIDIWAVPTTLVNSGEGMVVSDCKFGNENRHASDYFIVYADEAAGTSNGDQFPELAADSTNYITGHQFVHNNYYGPGVSLIYSTTPKVRACEWSGLLNVSSTMELLKFRTAPLPDYANNTNKLGPFLGIVGRYITPLAKQSASGIGWVVDERLTPAGSPVPHFGGGSATQFVPLVTSLDTTPSYLGTGASAAITDAIGGTDARELTLAADDDAASFVRTGDAHSANTPMWLEFDAKVGSTDPMNSVQVFVLETVDAETQYFHFGMAITPQAEWKLHRYSFSLTQKMGTTIQVQFIRLASQTGTKVKVGRVRLYQADEPTIWTPVTSTLPTASKHYRGKQMMLEASAADDEIYACRKTSAGAYAWVRLDL